MPQLRCWLGLYVSADKALLPTKYETDAGFHYSSDPIHEFDNRDKTALTIALREAMRVGNPVIPAPSRDELKKRTAMERLINAKSWKDLERKTIYFSIKCFDTEFRVVSWGRAPDGTWGPEKEHVLDTSVLKEEGVEAVAEIIIAHLKTRTDLPGLAMSG